MYSDYILWRHLSTIILVEIVWPSTEPCVTCSSVHAKNYTQYRAEMLNANDSLNSKLIEVLKIKMLLIMSLFSSIHF